MSNVGKNLLLAFIIVIGIFCFLSWKQIEKNKRAEELITFSDAKGFWRGEVTKSKHGYLLTQKHIPMRAIARRPNVPMFADKNSSPAESFRKVMRPWKPYYIYEYDAARGALRVAEKAKFNEKDALWVLETDVYCWTTRETINIEEPLPIYETLEDAKAGRNRLKDSYLFTFSDRFEELKKGQNKNRLPKMPSLPVLRREEGVFWSFIRPDPEPKPEVDRPYQVCWIRWDPVENNAKVRLRVTRWEFEEYMEGLQKLLFDYRYGAPDEKSTAHREIMVGAQAVTTGEEEKNQVRSVNNTILKTRTEGIPHPSGVLLRSIESALQAADVAKRLKDCAKMGNDTSLWSRAEIAYIEVDRMP